MTQDELLSRLNGDEWNDFEVKEARSDVPKSAWETVSALQCLWQAGDIPFA